MPKPALEQYCELVAALKLRTTKKAGRHLSTKHAIELLEQFGVETAHGLVRAPSGVLARSTVNEYLTRWHLGQDACAASLRPCASRQIAATTAGSSICRRPTSITSTSPIGLILQRECRP